MAWPVIGVLGGFRERADHFEDEYHLNAHYIDAVTAAEGIPALLAPCDDDRRAEEVLRRLDGLLIAGGPDIPPDSFGQEAHPETRPVHPRRWRSDRCYLGQALRREMPVLGICYGAQLLNVFLGGSLFQDLPSQRPSGAAHRTRNFEARHAVRVAPGTRLREILASDAVEVNSAHHQGIDRLGTGLRVNAQASDGLVEGIEADRGRFVIGVQWHPEELPDGLEQGRLFRALVKEALRAGYR